MKMSEQQIRAYGLEWPGSSVVQERAVIEGGQIDLDATLRALESAADFYQRELSAMAAFSRTWQAPMDDVTDRADEYRARASELAAAIAHVKALIARARG